MSLNSDSCSALYFSEDLLTFLNLFQHFWTKSKIFRSLSLKLKIVLFQFEFRWAVKKFHSKSWLKDSWNSWSFSSSHHLRRCKKRFKKNSNSWFKDFHCHRRIFFIFKRLSVDWFSTISDEVSFTARKNNFCLLFLFWFSNEL